MKHKKTTLILEGSGHDLEVLQELLQENGYAVSKASSSSLQVSEVTQVEPSPDLQIEEKGAFARFRSDLDGKLYEVRQKEDVCFEVSPPPYGSEQHYRDVFLSAPVGIFRSSIPGKLLSVNPVCASMLKYDSPRDMIETVNRTGIAESLYLDANHRDEILSEVLGSAGWHVFEEKFRCKDGSLIDCFFHLRAVRDDQGRPLEFEGFVRDESVRKRAEKQLKFTQFAIDNSIDQAFWSGTDGRFIYVNDAACRTLGYSREELLQMSVPEIAVSFSAETFAEHQRELKEKGFLTFETMHRAKDGRNYPVEIRANYVVFDGKEYACAFATDISERKRTEEALKLGQEMIDGASMGIFRGSDDGRILSVNDYWARKLGYTPAELRSMTFFDIDPTLTKEFWQEHRQKVTTTGFNTFESVHRCKDGTEIPVEVTVNLFRYQDRVYSCSFAKDISERKQAEKTLREAQLVLENSPAVVFHWGPSDDWPVKMVSGNVTQFGFTAEELLSGGVTYAALVHPDDLSHLVAEVHGQIDRGEDIFTLEYRIVTKQGEVRWVEERSLIERDAEGRVAGYQGIVLDVTERKQAEEAMRQANLVLENSPAVLFRWCNAEGWPVEMVSANVTQFGYSQDELLSGYVPFAELVHPEDLTRVAAEVQGHMRRKEDRFTQEYRIVTKQGEVRWVDDRTVIERDAGGRVCHYQGVIIDITERKEAEEMHRLSEERLQSLFRVAPAGMGMVSDRVISEVNPRVCEMTGYTAEELIGKSARMLYPTQEEYDLVGKDKYAQIEAEGIGEVETRWLRKDGNIVDVLLASAPLDPSDLSRGVSFTALDITDRKRTELVMAARMRLFQFAATHTLDELLEATLDEAEELTGSKIGFYHFLEEDQQTLSLQNWSTRTKRDFCTAQGKGLHYPVSQAGVWVDCIHQRRPVIHDDYAALPHRKGLPPGHAPVVRELVVPVFRGEKIVAILGVGNKPRSYTPEDVETVSLLADLAWSIVENTRAEQALQESERNYRSIVEHAPFGITRSTRDGKLLSVNPALASILKYDSAEELRETINRSTIQDVLFPKPSEREPLVENILAGDSWTVFNNRLRCKDGSMVTCRVHSRWILDADGQTDEFESFQENITDQLAAEEALRESEERFRVLAETSPVAICLYQGEHVSYANPAMERLFGYSAEELCRMKFWDWVHADFKEQVRIRGLARLAGEAVPGQYEVQYVTKEGEELHVLVSAGVMKHQGRFIGVASFLDITERKRTEELIKKSLVEKEMLLREIHHRVKNNLQVVSGLLYLQSQKLTDPELQSHFIESQNRICSMALAHELLYQSKSLADIDVGSYVENLVAQLQQAFQRDGQQIECRTEIEEIVLDIEKVVPCGLLITELLSNAYKHAFPDDRKGIVTVSMRHENGSLLLSVADDGVGLPVDLDYRRTATLGLQLVMALVNQLNANIDVERENGTLFRVIFGE